MDIRSKYWSFRENINLINSTLEIKEGEVIIESNNIPLAYSVKRVKEK